MLNNVFRQSAAYDFESVQEESVREESVQEESDDALDDDYIRVDLKGLCKPTRLFPLTQGCLKA